MFPEIDPVAGAEKQAKFIQSTIEVFEISKLTPFEPSHPFDDAFLNSPIQGKQPFPVRASSRPVAKNEKFIIIRFEQMWSL